MERDRRVGDRGEGAHGEGRKGEEKEKGWGGNLSPTAISRSRCL